MAERGVWPQTCSTLRVNARETAYVKERGQRPSMRMPRPMRHLVVLAEGMTVPRTWRRRRGGKFLNRVGGEQCGFPVRGCGFVAPSAATQQVGARCWNRGVDGKCS